MFSENIFIYLFYISLYIYYYSNVRECQISPAPLIRSFFN